MKKNSLGILDSRPEYALRLSSYLTDTFFVRTFSTPERAREGLGQEPADVFLVAEPLFREEDRALGRRVFLLTDGSSDPDADPPVLSRFMPADELAARLTGRGETAFSPGNASGIILTGASSGSCGKTAFSLMLAMKLAREGETLLWCQDLCPGWDLFSGMGEDAAALCYAAETGLPLRERLEALPVLSGVRLLGGGGDPRAEKDILAFDPAVLCGALLREGVKFAVVDTGTALPYWPRLPD